MLQCTGDRSVLGREEANLFLILVGEGEDAERLGSGRRSFLRCYSCEVGLEEPATEAEVDVRGRRAHLAHPDEITVDVDERVLGVFAQEVRVAVQRSVQLERAGELTLAGLVFFEGLERGILDHETKLTTQALGLSPVPTFVACLGIFQAHLKLGELRLTDAGDSVVFEFIALFEDTLQLGKQAFCFLDGHLDADEALQLFFGHIVSGSYALEKLSKACARACAGEAASS